MTPTNPAGPYPAPATEGVARCLRHPAPVGRAAARTAEAAGIGWSSPADVTPSGCSRTPILDAVGESR